MGNSCGLFLDLDGTLADSLGVMRKIYENFLASHSRPASDSEFTALNGPPLREVVSLIKGTHGLDESLEDLLSEYWELIGEAYCAVSPTQGAGALLEAASSNGWTVGVVTSNLRDLTESWLARTRLDKWVDVVVAGGETGKGKPSPDPYLLALERGGCPASASIALEDSYQGAKAAVAAGLRTYGYESSPEAALQWPGGVSIITDLAQLIPRIVDEAPERSRNA